MELVVNNVVKMEWDKKGWLQKKGGAFVFATKEYESSNKGTVTVFFRGNMAFLWASDPHTEEEDLWEASDLKDYVKREGVDGAFPNMYDEYIPVIDSGEVECDAEILEEYGLTEYKEDIEKRLEDILPYSDERSMEG